MHLFGPLTNPTQNNMTHLWACVLHSSPLNFAYKRRPLSNQISLRAAELVHRLTGTRSRHCRQAWLHHRENQPGRSRHTFPTRWSSPVRWYSGKVTCSTLTRDYPGSSPSINTCFEYLANWIDSFSSINSSTDLARLDTAPNPVINHTGATAREGSVSRVVECVNSYYQCVYWFGLVCVGTFVVSPPFWPTILAFSTSRTRFSRFTLSRRILATFSLVSST